MPQVFNLLFFLSSHVFGFCCFLVLIVGWWCTILYRFGSNLGCFGAGLCEWRGFWAGLLLPPPPPLLGLLVFASGDEEGGGYGG